MSKILLSKKSDAPLKIGRSEYKLVGPQIDSAGKETGLYHYVESDTKTLLSVSLGKLNLELKTAQKTSDPKLQLAFPQLIAFGQIGGEAQGALVEFLGEDGLNLSVDTILSFRGLSRKQVYFRLRILGRIGCREEFQSCKAE